jgi:hypothetical protein
MYKLTKRMIDSDSIARKNSLHDGDVVDDAELRIINKAQS